MSTMTFVRWIKSYFIIQAQEKLNMEYTDDNIREVAKIIVNSLNG